MQDWDPMVKPSLRESWIELQPGDLVRKGAWLQVVTAVLRSAEEKSRSLAKLHLEIP